MQIYEYMYVSDGVMRLCKFWLPMNEIKEVYK